MKKYIFTIVSVFLGSLLFAQRPKNCRECIETIEEAYRAKISKIQEEKFKAQQELYGYRSGKIKPPNSTVAPSSPNNNNLVNCKEDYWRGRYNTANKQSIIYKKEIVFLKDSIRDKNKEKQAVESAYQVEMGRYQTELNKSLAKINEQDSIILVLIKEKEECNNKVVTILVEKEGVAKLFGKNSLQIFAEYDPPFGRKRYIPLDYNNPVKEAANLDRDVEIKAEHITRLVIVGNLLLEDDAGRLRGDINLKFGDTNVSKKVDFIKQTDKVGESSVFTCRYNEEELIRDKTGKRKKTTTKLKNNETYTIEIMCKDQKHSANFRLD